MARSGALIMFCLGIISVALIITCVSGNDWAFNSFNKQPVRVGLWKRCIGPAGQDACIVLGDNVDSWTQAVRALAVLTCLFAFIGTVISLLLLCAKNLPSRYITWFFLCGACAMTVSLIIFGVYAPTANKSDSSDSPTSSMGWCYIVGWIGVIFNFATFFFGFCADKF